MTARDFSGRAQSRSRPRARPVPARGRGWSGAPGGRRPPAVVRPTFESHGSSTIHRPASVDADRREHRERLRRIFARNMCAPKSGLTVTLPNTRIVMWRRSHAARTAPPRRTRCALTVQGEVTIEASRSRTGSGAARSRRRRGNPSSSIHRTCDAVLASGHSARSLRQRVYCSSFAGSGSSSSFSQNRTQSTINW